MILQNIRRRPPMVSPTSGAWRPRYQLKASSRRPEKQQGSLIPPSFPRPKELWRPWEVATCCTSRSRPIPRCASATKTSTSPSSARVTMPSLTRTVPKLGTHTLPTPGSRGATRLMPLQHLAQKAKGQPRETHRHDRANIARRSGQASSPQAVAKAGRASPARLRTHLLTQSVPIGLSTSREGFKPRPPRSAQRLETTSSGYQIARSPVSSLRAPC